MAIDPLALGMVLFGLLEVALACILFGLGVSNPNNRRYALMALLVAAMGICDSLYKLVADPVQQQYFLRAGGYFHMAAPAVFWFFVIGYPRPPARWLEGPVGMVALVACMVVPAAWYAFDHSLFLSMKGLKAEGFCGFQETDCWTPQPLANYRLYGLKLAIGAGAWVLIHRAQSERSPLTQRAMLLMGTTIGAWGAFQGIARVWLSIHAGAWTAAADGPVDDLILCALVLGSVVSLDRLRRRVGAPRLRRFVERCLWLVLLGAVTGFISGWVGMQVPFVRLTFLALWTLLHPATITYCILRHQVFDLDSKLRSALDGGTLLAIYGLVFLLVARASKAFVAAAFPGQHLAFALLATGALLFVLDPLHDLTRRLARRAIPGLSPPSELTRGDRLSFYEAQVLLVASDGRISPDERRMLELARRRLGLSQSQAADIERIGVKAI